MRGHHVEGLSDYLLQSELHDNWNGFSLGHATEPQRQTEGGHDDHASASNEDASEQVTSPPLACYSDILKEDDGLGGDLGCGPLMKDYAIPCQPEPAYCPESEAARRNRSMQLVNSNFGQLKPPVTETPRAATTKPLAIKPAPPTLRASQCQSIWSSRNDDMLSFSRASTTKRSATSDDDRGYRKKSREKMRRLEVNVKFEGLVGLLGFTNSTRKKDILHETVSTIKSLKRECNHLRRDRDRLQQEVKNLAMYLQYSQLGPEANIYGSTTVPFSDPPLEVNNL
ncbi:hypothetical protein PHYPSEUDO_003207 [Phytophthora pseudosyringae]|uniref:BHLH domain-containing protein n=1 Tax=Phytophthora pseudosyringae TaxID=221518 RepID=A0A8T1VWH9_9STRA|nr:hypothetical protein PHYPSEUDO_003207 [Phytophthora pseudosyringae]